MGKDTTPFPLVKRAPRGSLMPPRQDFQSTLSQKDSAQGAGLAVQRPLGRHRCRGHQFQVGISGGAALPAENSHFQSVALDPQKFNYSRFGDFYLVFGSFVRLLELDLGIQLGSC